MKSDISNLTSQISNPSRALVVTADDFGFGFETSKGIIQAHHQGPVTATSVMIVTGDHVRRSIELLGGAPNLDVGIHIVLTHCGHSPLIAKRSSGIVDRQGKFLSNGRLWLAALSRRIDMNAVAEEIAAQAMLFTQLVGRPPTHVDSHHHSHQLPGIREALLKVIEGKILPPMTRTTVEPPELFKKVPGVRVKRRAARWLGRRAQSVFSAHGLRTNDYFLGMLAPDDLKRDFPWQEQLRHIPETGVTEWVVHPGLPDETLEGRDDYRAERADELAALTDPARVKYWEPLRALLGRKSREY